MLSNCYLFHVTLSMHVLGLSSRSLWVDEFCKSPSLQREATAYQIKFIPAQVRNECPRYLTEWLPFFSAFFIQLFVGWLEFYVCWSATTDAYGNGGHYHWLLNPATSHAASSVPCVVTVSYTISLPLCSKRSLTGALHMAHRLKVTHFNTP